MSEKQTPAQPLGRITLKNVRLSFADGVHEAKGITGADGKPGKPRYNCGLIISGDDKKLLELIEETTQEVAKAKWKDKAPAILKGLAKQDKLALHDGDTKPKYDGYPGNFYLSPGRDEKDGQPSLKGHVPSVELTDKEKRKLFYSGAYVNAYIELWAQDNNFGQRINATLRGLQFVKDGDAFGSRVDAAGDDEMEEIEGSDADDIS